MGAILTSRIGVAILDRENFGCPLVTKAEEQEAPARKRRAGASSLSNLINTVVRFQ